VSRKTLRGLADRFHGGVFQYRLNANIESIIQEVIEWGERGNEIVSEQKKKERENENEILGEREFRFVKEPIPPSC
jgi:hypothetical protein